MAKRQIHLIVFVQEDGTLYFDIETSKNLQVLLGDIRRDGFTPQVFPIDCELIDLSSALAALNAIDSAHEETMTNNKVSTRKSVFYGLLQEIAKIAYEAGRADEVAKRHTNYRRQIERLST